MQKVHLPPCQKACPAGTNISRYIRLILEGDLYEAWKVNRAANVFPSVCGRVCVHYCEADCKRKDLKSKVGPQVSTKAVSIRGLKRFITDNVPPDYAKRFLDEILPIKKNNKKVAVIGAGPAGLAAANDLILSGCDVEVFEALPDPGGMLRVGIPSYRLPTDVLMEEIDLLKKLGIKIRLNCAIGRDVTLESLRKDFDAVFVASGAHKAMLMEIEGEQLEGIFSGIDFLRKLVLGEDMDVKGKAVAVVGGGFTAADAARCALRHGAKPYVVYRRGREEMPMDEEEKEALDKENIPVHYLTAPVEVLSNDGKKAAKLRCVKMELKEVAAGGSQTDRRRRPVPIPNSEFEIEADIVIPAIAQKTDHSIFPDDFKFNTDDFSTSMEGVFVGGDFLYSATTDVIKVIGQAHEASIRILKFLDQKPKSPDIPQKKSRSCSPWCLEDTQKLSREKVYGGWLEPSMEAYEETEEGTSRELAAYESSRCLQCDFYIVLKNDVTCHRCENCVMSCPQGALKMERKEVTRDHPGAWFNKGHWQTDESAKVQIDPEICIQCGACVQVCPNKCISFAYRE